MRLLLIALLLSHPSFAKRRAKPIDRNVDPYRYVWPKSEKTFPGLTRFFVDINDDGKPDLFVGETEFMKPGGGPFEVYLVNGPRSYQHIGRVLLHPSTLKVLPEKNEGVHDVGGKVLGANTKTVIYSFDGKLLRKREAEIPEDVPLATLSEIEQTGNTLKWKP